ncbi:hypothetical protein TNCT_167391 [Trichonephila clavata]|uniref:Uncharacterized protein n=1 Tax=Trichonephila clavata TaxID=2740835 RepID=A0A8X6GZE6_TRICU|nr:hypothetical protein TNCT_167391 [Trichonephila clavata]
MFSDRERNESATSDISPSCPEKWRKEGIESSKPEEESPAFEKGKRKIKKKNPWKMEDVSSRGLQEKKLLRALSSEPVAVHGRKMFSAEKEIQSLDRKDTEKKLAWGSSFFGHGAQNAALLNFVPVLRGGGGLKL